MENELTKHDVYGRIIQNIQKDALFVLAAIKRKEGLVKHQLEEEANAIFQKQYPSTKLINSRFSLDNYVAKLEGASLIEIRETGRSKQYYLSDIGQELIQYYESNL
ncbi:hypothetical protein [Gracilibacillus sp. YIM 98692]|uniref:hypothetical protein n=1 Tax=Gracilibacillus sp. YIM 98692 TaxID=2663532 RepID=UPI0013D67B98|nr:hypothetical protein [Gracilibacillus sp. YIM 98692]